MEQREGNNSDSVRVFKKTKKTTLPLIKYIPSQTAPAFLKAMMQTLTLATDCHSIHQRFSLRIIVEDASGARSVHLEDNTFGEEPPAKKKEKKRELPGEEWQKNQANETEMSSNL